MGMVPKLVCFDMDGVIFKENYFWNKVHEAYGTLELGLQLNKKYLYTDYHALVHEVMKLWKGKTVQPIFDIVANSEYNPGVRETIKEIKQRGVMTAIISNGSWLLAKRAKQELGISHIFANEIHHHDGLLDGTFTATVDMNGKGVIVARLCEALGITPADVAAVGDDDNDIVMMELVGKSIAFNTRSEKLKNSCDIVVEGNDLRKILPYLF